MQQGSVEQIESILGRALEADKEGSVADLNTMPRRIIEEARQLPPVLRYRFLWHYVDFAQHPYLPSFIQDIIDNSGDPSSWHRGRILVPSFVPEDLLTHDVPSIVAGLEPHPNEQWKRIRPDRERWDANDSIVGAPAIVRPELSYRWSAPEHVFDMLLPHDETLEPVTDIVIATRRWIASRVAHAMQPVNRWKEISDPMQFVASMFPGVQHFTNDALIAIQALLTEQRHIIGYDQQVPGFQGPDKWYAGDLSLDT